MILKVLLTNHKSSVIINVTVSRIVTCGCCRHGVGSQSLCPLRLGKGQLLDIVEHEILLVCLPHPGLIFQWTFLMDAYCGDLLYILSAHCLHFLTGYKISEPLMLTVYFQNSTMIFSTKSFGIVLAFRLNNQQYSTNSSCSVLFEYSKTGALMNV